MSTDSSASQPSGSSSLFADKDLSYITYPVLIGIIVFLAITGGRILNPMFDDWLYHWGDPSTMMLGWSFFRNTPLLQWPLGLNPDYGMDYSSTIVFSDSLPILALLFKPFAPLLPVPFQYFGFWFLLNMILQAFFAWQLLLLFNNKDRLLLTLATLFFVLAPIFLRRIAFHYALGSLWILTAGFYFYFRKSFSPRAWFLLLLTASLVHAYLLVMAGAIFAADILQRLWKREASWAAVIFTSTAIATCVPLAMLVAGYFVNGEGFMTNGYGWYRLNLLSYIDPNDVSIVLPDFHNGRGNTGSSYSYLGFGFLCLMAVSLCRLFPLKLKTLDLPTLAPITLMSLACLAFAISNRISIGSYDVYIFNLPAFTDPITSTFRASSRFSWLLYDLFYIGTFYLLFTRFKKRTAAILIAMTLAVQIVDLYPQLSKLRNITLLAEDWAPPMKSPLWKKLSNHYKSILIWPIGAQHWKEWAAFACNHKMKVNACVLARINQVALFEHIDELKTGIILKKLDPEALYFFDRERFLIKNKTFDKLWTVSKHQASEDDLIGTLDGFRILAAGFLKSHPEVKPLPLDDSPDFTFPASAEIDVHSGDLHHFVYGWKEKPDEKGEGLETDEIISAILLTLAPGPSGSVELLLEGSDLNLAKVYVNGALLETFSGSERNDDAIRITLPASFVKGCKGRVTLAIETGKEKPVRIRKLAARPAQSEG